MVDLNRPGQFADVDAVDMLSRLLQLPDQVREAWSLGMSVELPPSHRDAAHVVICGMGGSAIGGDLVRTLVEHEARMPIAVVRAYDLPGFVGRDSLVIVSSFSGDTEETLSACDAALASGARVVAITTGGTLASRARDWGFPLVRFSYHGQPREAVGFSLLLTLALLGRLGYVEDRGGEIEVTASLLEDMAAELGPESPAEANIAKRLALRSFGKIGLVYGGGLMSEVARRWKGQLNENAKHWSFFEHLPELNHNAVLGYQFPTDIAARVLVIMLSSEQNHSRVRLREEITAEVLGRWGVATEMVKARGDSRLQQMLSATYVGDFFSYYLALLNDVDPSEIDTISFLKARLAHVGFSHHGNGSS
jgi:glucose/mannose-6-phosphate isomerase